MDILVEFSKYVESIPLNTTEWIFLVLLVYGAISGMINGFLKELASMTGFFIGLFLAWKYSGYLQDGALAFVAIWILTPVALGMLASLATKLLDWTVVGGLLNRMLGCLFGVTKWAVLVICITVVTGQTEYLDKYVDHHSLPGVDYIEKKWKTLQENL